MKKILFVLFLPVISLAQPANGFVIRGNISGIKDNTEVMLLNGSDGKNIATEKVDKGIFTFTGKLNEPEILLIKISGNNEVIDMYLHNDAVSVSGSLSDIKNIKVKGAALQEDYAMYKEKVTPLIDKLKVYAALINPEKDVRKRDSLIGEYTICKTKTI